MSKFKVFIPSQPHKKEDFSYFFFIMSRSGTVHGQVTSILQSKIILVFAKYKVEPELKCSLGRKLIIDMVSLLPSIKGVMQKKNGHILSPLFEKALSVKHCIENSNHK